DRSVGRDAAGAAVGLFLSCMLVFPTPATDQERKVPMTRVFNFSPGPATLPEPVLRQAADEMLDWHGSGMSVMEMSHRGKEFIAIHAEAEALARELLGIPANYKVLFMQGGAIGENAIVPMNLIGASG